MEDRIEQRVAIRAPLDLVWSLVATPGWWLPGSTGARAAEPARRPGRAMVSWGHEPQPWIIDVVRVEPQGYASFRWASAFGGVAPAPGNATLVEFYVRPAVDMAGVPGEVGVTVVESGLASLNLPVSLREDRWKANTGEWQYELAGLRFRAEGAASLAGGHGEPVRNGTLRARGREVTRQQPSAAF